MQGRGFMSDERRDEKGTRAVTTAKQIESLSKDARIAASECVRLMGVLAQSSIANHQMFATIVAARLLAIIANGAGDPCDPCPAHELRGWVALAEQLVTGQNYHALVEA